MLHKEILEDLTKDCPCVLNGDGDKWCFLKELIAHCGMNDRDVEQLRLIYDYKYILSELEKKDIGRQRAFTEFIAKYAKKFAEVYEEGMRHDDLFEKVFGFKKGHTDKQIREHIYQNR